MNTDLQANNFEIFWDIQSASQYLAKCLIANQTQGEIFKSALEYLREVSNRDK